MLVALLGLVACSPGDGEETGTATCGPTAPGTAGEACPLADCAAGCTVVEEAIACCVATFGRGLSEVAAETLAASCEGAACDPYQYLSDAAAVCAAQVHGLSPGAGACAASLQGDATRPRWYVRNTLDPGCETAGDTHGEGLLFVIDATSGAYETYAQWFSTFECPS